MEGKESTGKIIEHYPLLFTYPSYHQMVLTILLTSILGSIAFFYLDQGLSSLKEGLFYGILLFLLLVTTDYLINPLFRNNEILNPRRITILSYSGLLLYFIPSLVLELVPNTTQSITAYSGFFLSISVISAIRTLVFHVFTDEKPQTKWLAILIQPASLFLLNKFFLNIKASLTPRYALGIALMVVGVELSLWLFEKEGRKIWRGGLISLFKGFLYAWAEDKYEKLEQEVSIIGELVNLECDVLNLKGQENSTAFLIPYIHPGPFRKMGSSPLPEKLVAEYMEKKRSEAIVAHGISTHELDIINHNDMKKVLEKVTNTALSCTENKCSQIIRKKINNSIATCQLFGKLALITLSLHQKSYDDLPSELLQTIRGKAEMKGFTIIVIDSHNSIQLENELTPEDVESLEEAAMEALYEAAEKPQHSFKTGFSRIIPKEWDNNVGMGGSGIAALTLILQNGLKFTYIVFDGNNMKKGLKEKIHRVGAKIVDDLVVMTSDTHVVNALGATSRGYYPVGEKMNEDRILFYVKEIIVSSIEKQEISKLYYGRSEIPDVTVLGKGGLDKLAYTAEKGFALFVETFSLITGITLLSTIAIIFL